VRFAYRLRVLSLVALAPRQQTNAFIAAAQAQRNGVAKNKRKRKQWRLSGSVNISALSITRARAGIAAAGAATSAASVTAWPMYSALLLSQHYDI